MNYEKWSFWFALIALAISIPSLFYSRDAYDLARNQLVNVQNKLTSLEHELNGTNNFIFLKTPNCQRVYFTGQWASCWNGTYWNSCINNVNFTGFNCKNQQWFIEVNQTYSWQNTNGTFGIN